MIGGSQAEHELATMHPWETPAAPIAAAERAARIAAARDRLDAIGADALLVHAGPSLRYFTGIPWSPTERLVALLLPCNGSPLIVCPHFELGSLVASLQLPMDVVSWEEDDDPLALVIGALPPAAVLAVDPLLPFAWGSTIANQRRTVNAAPLIDGLRARKSAAELALMTQAKAMTLEVQRRAARILTPGIRASTVRRFIDDAHRALGAPGSTFCAVQFGRATAFPHGLPGDQQLAADELVLVDTGCVVDGYHSDITRTYAFGKVDEAVHTIWEVEQAAQAAAFAAVRPGVPCAAIDAAARDVLVRAGLGPGYSLPGLPHRTGHGIGLSIHEPPYLVRGDATPLALGMCFSSEPMIVVPDRFGVRLEDHFHVITDGARWFTPPQSSLENPFP
ncbi:M24 family metallopeptidase [Sphingomonas sp. CLY1604]|uniref:M24 family metallopeptidase n=1 Tax=Sphingomonas sp. CLY1604 TaxID=3457786 RepID=UPI003FD7CECE